MLWVESERLGDQKTKVETAAAARGNVGDGRLKPAGNTVSPRRSQGPFHFFWATGYLINLRAIQRLGLAPVGSLSRPRGPCLAAPMAHGEECPNHRQGIRVPSRIGRLKFGHHRAVYCQKKGITMTDSHAVQMLLARQEIADVIYRYARGIDRLDFEQVRACYHPDAYDDHGSMKGNVDEFIAAASSFLTRWTATQHFMGNMLIEIEGDLARAETYAVAYHRREDAAGNGKDDVLGIRYVDRFERREGVWKIAHRVVATEWRRVDPVVGARGRGEVGVWGRRDGDDVVNWIMTARPPA